LLSALLAGCDPAAPAGQVVARVNGEEITRRDLQIELKASGLPADVDLKSVQPALLEAIVARKLLAAEARLIGLDRNPDYLAAMRRNREILLLDQYREQVMARGPVPTEAEVARFIAANASRFDNRRLILVDRIQASARGIHPQSLRTAASNDGIARLLETSGHGFSRGPVAFDTLTAPAALILSLEAQPAGRPVVRLDNGVLVIDAVSAISAISVGKAERATIAKTMMQGNAAASEISDTVAGLRKASRIDYQTGFGS
jgi:EpsD family peptidyl-prolyl cis-trans isomerase